MIIAGALLSIIGFFGCYGALRENKCFLGLFFVIVGLILLLEIVAGSLVIVNAERVSQLLSSSLVR